MIIASFENLLILLSKGFIIQGALYCRNHLKLILIFMIAFPAIAN